jgi:superfamily II RNA helicase
VKFKGYTLNSFQVRAAQALRAGKNVLLSAPTGAGKTLVAEYAIEATLGRGRRAIYTSPIKALSNQKYRDFRADGVEVGLMTGDLTLEPAAPVVIMTTEIFRNSVFEDPTRFDSVDFVIFDEIHYLDDPERGTVWEESLIFAPQHVRIVGLSATISNLEQFGKWLRSVRQQGLEVIHHAERPVPLQHELFHPATGRFALAQRKRAIANLRRGKMRRRDGGRRQRRLEGPLALVLDQLERERLLPVLCFCFSRRECEVSAEANQHRELLSRSEVQRIDALFREICAKFELDPTRDPALAGIERRALHGVGFHHAGMLPIHKEVVERLFTSGLLKLLFTTETFALGINMPARTVVFESLRKFDGVEFGWLRTRDYMQMAGRAGRQGIDDAGLVISVLGDDDLEDAPLVRLFANRAEPVVSRFNLSYSTIVNLYERMGADLAQAYEKSFAAFQSEGGARAREQQRRQALRDLDLRVSVLREAGFLDEDGLLPRGRLAQKINGYEIQIVELLFDGILDELDLAELACAFAALVHSERRGDLESPRVRGLRGPVMRRVNAAIERFRTIEAQHGFKQRIKAPDWGVVPAVLAWCRGVRMVELRPMLDNDGGDLVRTLRMAIQMMRQLGGALSGDYPLIHRLDEAIVAINRDEVDAKRQFELG